MAKYSIPFSSGFTKDRVRAPRQSGNLSVYTEVGYFEEEVALEGMLKLSGMS
jgi:hypothetical protein